MIALAPYVAGMAALAAVVLLWGRVRLRGVLAYALAFGGLVAGAVDVTGIPKPIELEWRETGEVIGVQYVPGVAIYVWIAGDPPRAYRLPWSEKTAREAQEEARKGMRYVMHYEDQDPTFHPMPQPIDPPKQ